jgi:ribosome-binding protein aMBF1 (putative translation factor)
MQRSCSRARTKDALKILDQMIGDDADMRQMIAEETLKAELARMIYEARTAAGLTQQALAARVGTKPSGDRPARRC